MVDGLQVIGVGWHRTGSMSVKAAWERLGFGPCYHGMEALRRNRDGRHWLTAYQADGDFDWPVIFNGYRSAMDWPTVYFWEKLIKVYPEAKVVLTVRDPESWWDSHLRMFRTGAEVVEGFSAEQHQWAQESGFSDMQAALGTIPAAVFDGRLFDKEHCIQVFQQHNEKVRQLVPEDRLLIYRVQDGWKPLCRFLEVDVPDEPFPTINVGDKLVINIQAAMAAAKSGSDAPVWQ